MKELEKKSCFLDGITLNGPIDFKNFPQLFQNSITEGQKTDGLQVDDDTYFTNEDVRQYVGMF